MKNFFLAAICLLTATAMGDGVRTSATGDYRLPLKAHVISAVPGYNSWPMIQDGKDVLEKVKRFDMKGFRPPKPYIRELKRYGVLPGSFDDEKDPIDPYKTDRLYWALDWTSLR